MFISEKIVDNHRKNIKKQHGIDNSKAIKSTPHRPTRQAVFINNSIEIPVRLNSTDNHHLVLAQPVK
jgi:hypothetical protein